jgi:hypothetical protein
VPPCPPMQNYVTTEELGASSLALRCSPRHYEGGAENATKFMVRNHPRRAVPHLKRSCDLSSLTSSAAHSQASGIFPASRKARAFAKAWLSADRLAADSFPGRAVWALRSAADVLRICY